MIKKIFYKVLELSVKRNPILVMKARYFKTTNKKLDLDNPTNIQEKVFKIYYERYKTGKIQDLADLTDKIKVRNYIEEKIGSKYLTKLLGQWVKPENIEFDKLPNSFVLKTNNGCGNNVIIKNKIEELDKKKIIKSLKNWLSFPYGSLTGQPHYSLIEPKILCEEFLVQNNKMDLPSDYKFFCFKGVPKFILYYEGRQPNGHIVPNQAYDMNWNIIPNSVRNPINKVVAKPKSLDEMILIAKELSKDFKFVRVDLYEINDKPIFGELTFTPDMLTNFTGEFLSKLTLS